MKSKIFMGIDLAKKNGDYTCIAELEHLADGTFKVKRIRRMKTKKKRKCT